MASLFKRKNGLFYAQFHDVRRQPAKKQLAVGTRHRRRAIQLLGEMETAYEQGRFDPWSPDRLLAVPRGDASLGTAFADFLETRSNLSPYSQTKYRSVVGLLIDFLGNDRSCRSVTATDITSFLNASDRKPVTRKTYYSTLRTFFRWQVSVKLIHADPTAGVRLERVPEKNPLCLWARDVEKIVLAVESEARDNPAAAPGSSKWLIPILRFNIFAGLRAGEIVNLRWSDVDLRRRVLHVRNRDGFNTKSHRDRWLPMCPPAADVLRKLVRRSEFVFPSHTGRQLGRQYLSRRTKHFLRKAGYADMCFHSFRHSAASLLINNGASIEATRRYLGHSSILVTQRYLSVGDDALRRQVELAFLSATSSLL